MKQLPKELLQLMKACNDSPDFFGSSNFYEIKSAILHKYGKDLGCVLQVFMKIQLTFRSIETGRIYWLHKKITPNGTTTIDFPKNYFRDSETHEVEEVVLINSHLVGEHKHILRQYELEGELFYTPTNMFCYHVFGDKAGAIKILGRASGLYSQVRGDIHKVFNGFKKHKRLPQGEAEKNYKLFLASVGEHLGQDFIQEVLNEDDLPF